MSSETRNPDPVIETELGPKHLSHINGILYQSLVKNVRRLQRQGSLIKYTIRIHKCPANRDEKGKLYSWVRLFFYINHPSGIDFNEPTASYSIQLIRANVPRKLKRLEADIKACLAKEQYLFVKPYNKSVFTGPHGDKNLCCDRTCILLIFVTVMVILLIIGVWRFVS